eukprot:c7474_g1_i2.p1 GENE.c7474_g1_i2~~c7474_g1_i2.p1  ORF type:complete len:280 (-),score=60.28 c7474_g1_i2:74-871(-)
MTFVLGGETTTQTAAAPSIPQSLDLRWKGLNDVTGVCRTITTQPITLLNLGSNQIGVAGTQHLAAAIQSEKCSLTWLSLNFNCIGAEGVRHLATAIQSEHSNKIGDEGARHIATAIQTRKSALTKLNLYDNRIGDEGARYIAIALQSPNCSLRVLTLTKNLIGEEGARHIAFAVQTDTCKLTKLDMWNNRMLYLVSAVISQAVERSEPVHTVIMQHITCKDSEVTATELKAFLALASHSRWADVTKHILSKLLWNVSEEDEEDRW